jgi:hypothetical protein
VIFHGQEGSLNRSEIDSAAPQLYTWQLATSCPEKILVAAKIFLTALATRARQDREKVVDEMVTSFKNTL